MGNRRVRIIVGILLLAMLCGAAWRLLRPGELSYRGKSLGAWLDDLSLSYGQYPTETEDAVRHIGTNAIPTLLKMLRAHDSPLKKKLIAMFGRQHLVRIKITTEEDKYEQAAFAFAALGPAASNAVPDLMEIYDEKISPDNQCNTAYALSGIGPAANPAIPSLLRGLKSTNETVRLTSMDVLGKIHGDPASVVPELVNILHDSNSLARRFAAQALGEFGTNARSAVPGLIAMLNDRQPADRPVATNALNKIDPDAAAKAGVK